MNFAHVIFAITLISVFTSHGGNLHSASKPLNSISATSGGKIYVSLNGDDSALGEKTSPLRTIERAQKEVRLKLKSGLKAPLTVYVRGGFYELTKPLEFGPQDSGNSKFPVTYAGYPGEKVILSGGRRIKNWSKLKDKGWWKSVLPKVRDGDWFFRQLTVGDQRAVRARWPNIDGELRITKVSNGVTHLSFNKQIPSDIPVGQGTELVVYQNWCITRSLVKLVEKNSLTTVTPMAYIGHSYSTASPGKPAYLEHAFSLIDQPREWFLHRKSGSLIYYPKSGEHPSKTSVVAPVLQRLLRLKGTRENPIKHLHFENLRFAHTDFPLPKAGYAETQAAHYGVRKSDKNIQVQPVAIECTYTQNCHFTRCQFIHLGASGVGLGVGCKNNKLEACMIKDIGGNGLMIGWGGIGKKDKSLGADWAILSDAPSGNEVLNCYIKQCGMDSKGGVGIHIAFSADTRIAHNVIHDMPYTGMSIGFRWNPNPSSQVRCIVESNHIYDVMKKLADGGAIYTLGFQPGTTFRNNHIHQVHRSAFAHGGAPNNGFFLDEGSKGFSFSGNVVYDVSGAPVRFNTGRREYHTWKENHFSSRKPGDSKSRRVIQKAGIESRFLKK